MIDNQQRLFGKQIQNHQICLEQKTILDKRRITRSLSSQISQKENRVQNMNMSQIMEVEDIEINKKTEQTTINQVVLGLNSLDLQRYNEGHIESIYHQQIIDYLKHREHKWMISIDYMQKQSQINGQMRLVLVDWLCDVCIKFEFTNDTFYLTIFILDYYLQNNNVNRNRLQLVGISSLLVASKYDEIYLPQTSDYVKVTNESYSVQDLLKMETNILVFMSFDLSFGSFIQFYNRYAMFNQQSQKQNSMNVYILELTLLDIRSRQFQQNMLASAVIFLTNKLFKNPQCWNLELEQMTGYSQLQLKECAKYLLTLFQDNSRSKHNAIRLKFKHSKIDQLIINNLQLRMVQYIDSYYILKYEDDDQIQVDENKYNVIARRLTQMDLIMLSDDYQQPENQNSLEMDYNEGVIYDQNRKQQMNGESSQQNSFSSQIFNKPISNIQDTIQNMYIQNDRQNNNMDQIQQSNNESSNSSRNMFNIQRQQKPVTLNQLDNSFRMDGRLIDVDIKHNNRFNIVQSTTRLEFNNLNYNQSHLDSQFIQYFINPIRVHNQNDRHNHQSTFKLIMYFNSQIKNIHELIRKYKQKYDLNQQKKLEYEQLKQLNDFNQQIIIRSYQK